MRETLKTRHYTEASPQSLLSEGDGALAPSIVPFGDWGSFASRMHRF